MADYITAITTGLSSDAVWGVLTPIAGVVVIVTLIAVGRRVLNKNQKALKNGSAGKI